MSTFREHQSGLVQRRTGQSIASASTNQPSDEENNSDTERLTFLFDF